MSHSSNPIDVLIVGAGFAGSVVARQLAYAGYWVEILEKRLNRKGKIEFTSKNTQKSQPQFSIQKTQKLLNFKPKIELTDGLNQVLDWYLIHKNYTTFCASDSNQDMMM